MSTTESPRSTTRARTNEQTRARYPDEDGFIERHGVRVFWERYGSGEPTVLFLPTWSIIHSRCWKAQIPYFARHFRVLTFDGRGNGRSDRPQEPDAYRAEEFAADTLAVMDATGTERAVLVSLSRGAERSLLLGAHHPERVEGMMFIAPALPLPPAAARASAEREFLEPHDAYDGWAKWNSHYWLEHYEDFVEFFFAQVFNEPHSTKQIEDGLGWTEQTDVPAPSAIEALGRRGAARFVYSSIERDGMMSGPDLDEVRRIAQAVRGSFIYSGGVSSLEDLRALAGLRQVNLAGVIVGTALYERRFGVAEGQAALDG